LILLEGTRQHVLAVSSVSFQQEQQYQQAQQQQQGWEVVGLLWTD
jgi:hypothetical protein